jgi:hypothetical protein
MPCCRCNRLRSISLLLTIILYSIEERNVAIVAVLAYERGGYYTIHRVPECLSLRPNWLRPPPSLASVVWTPLDPKGGGDTRLRVRRRLGGQIRTTGEKAWHSVYSVHMSDAWTKGTALLPFCWFRLHERPTLTGVFYCVGGGGSVTGVDGQRRFQRLEERPWRCL